MARPAGSRNHPGFNHGVLLVRATKSLPNPPGLLLGNKFPQCQKENVMSVLNFIGRAIMAFIRWNWELDKPASERSYNNRPQRQITHAVQKGPYVDVYNGYSRLFTKQGDLYGYTSGSVSVLKFNSYVEVYDAHGSRISTANSY
jgi:hypothetical protein